MRRVAGHVVAFGALLLSSGAAAAGVHAVALGALLAAAAAYAAGEVRQPQQRCSR